MKCKYVIASINKMIKEREENIKADQSTILSQFTDDYLDKTKKKLYIIMEKIGCRNKEIPFDLLLFSLLVSAHVGEFKQDDINFMRLTNEKIIERRKEIELLEKVKMEIKGLYKE